MRHDANDRVWEEALDAARFVLVRDPAAYVSYDGRGVILVSPDEEMDEDDHLAQIVLHELCHHLVEGDASRNEVDWGLDNLTDADAVRELAALRVQAWLADGFGLRAWMVATTDFRPYYESLPADPLCGPCLGQRADWDVLDAQARAIAQEAAGRWPSWYLRPVVERALSLTSPATAGPQARAEPA
jgi:hypothetical protein